MKIYFIEWKYIFYQIKIFYQMKIYFYRIKIFLSNENIFCAFARFVRRDVIMAMIIGSAKSDEFTCPSCCGGITAPSITCGLSNLKLIRQMRFSLPSIKCSAAPPSCAQRFDLITARSTAVGSWEEPPNI